LRAAQKKGLLGGLWEFPGGKVEPGEELPAGLKREIREELAVDIAVGEHFGVYEHAYTHFRVTLHAFCCHLIDGEPQAIEASDLRWVIPSNLPEYPMGKIDREISKKLRKEEVEPGAGENNRMIFNVICVAALYALLTELYEQRILV
jgi:A/G-specific adenine glycosylase